MTLTATILILPGLGNSGAGHWQTIWEEQNPAFKRINQQDWCTPDCNDWVNTLDVYLEKEDLSNTILIGHSLACITIAFWAKKFNRKIKGALLVAPSDTEAESYPQGTTGFTSVPLDKLNFPTIVVTSTNDFYISLQRATLFANSWGSELINIGEAGHINVAAGFGNWADGLNILKKLY